MKALYVSLFLFIHALLPAQDSIPARSLKLSITVGNSQYFSSESSAKNQGLIRYHSNPILSGPFRFAAVNAELNLGKNIAAQLSVGYSALVGAYRLQTHDSSFIWTRRTLHTMPLTHSIFIEPALAYIIPLDEKLHLIPSLGISLNLKVSDGSGKIVNYDTPRFQTNFNQGATSVLFATLNPGIELRFLTTQSLRIGMLCKYNYGLADVTSLEGTYTYDEQTYNYKSTYRGDAVLIALKVGYCLPCL